MTDFQIGQVARLVAVFRNSAGAFADPVTSVKFIVKDPNGTESVYVYGVDDEVVKDSTGNYHLDLLLTAHGEWFYRFLGTSPLGAGVNTAAESWLKVRKSYFTQPLPPDP